MQKQFLRNIGLIGIGTISAQIIPFLCLPIFSRYFSLEAFTLYSLYMSWLGCTSAVAALRLEVKIPQLETYAEAKTLGVQAILLTAMLSLLILIIGCLSAQLWVILLAFSTFFNAATFIQYQFAYRLSAFSILSRNRILTAISIGVFSCLLAFFYPIEIGLCLGSTIGYGIGFLSTILWKSDNSIFQYNLKLRFDLSHLRPYVSHMGLNTVHTLISTLAEPLVFLVLAWVMESTAIAIIGMSLRLFKAPIQLVSGSLGRHLHAELSGLVRQQKPCVPLIRNTVMLSTVFALAILAIAALSPWAFPRFLGEQWTTSGEISVYFGISYALLSILNPISGLYLYLNSPQEGLYMSIIHTSLKIIACLSIPLLPNVSPYVLVAFGFFLAYCNDGIWAIRWIRKLNRLRPSELN